MPSKERILEGISAALRAAEDELRSQPSDAVAMHEEGASAIREGRLPAKLKDWSRLGLDAEDLALLRAYLGAVSFLAAWYDTKGEKERGQRLAHSAIMRVSLLGFDSEKVLRQIAEYTAVWKVRLDEPKRVGLSFGALFVLAFLVGIALALVRLQEALSAAGNSRLPGPDQRFRVSAALR